jgi:carboxyl-terminal processing protease
MHSLRSTFVRVAACAMLCSFAAMANGAAAPAFGDAAPSTLPAPTAGAVNESYRLLVDTYYNPIGGQTFLDAARAALIREAAKLKAKITVPPIDAMPDIDATSDSLDDAISEAANAAHGTQSEFAYAAIIGMARAADDKYTQFFTPEQFKQFNQALDPQKISGIGVLIAPDPTTKLISVSYVVPGTPADHAGLQSGDIIATIDGATTKGMALDAASKMLRGKAGTSVRLTVDRAENVTKDFTIVRSEIQPPTVVYKMLPSHIGYIYILAFGKDTPSEFDVALERLKDQGANALVLDLRDDGGGYVDSALQISSRFITEKPILTVEQRGEPSTTIRARNDAWINVPMTVLVNGYTASASEITAGALQDDGIAELVGTKTFGKGVMQTLTPLPDGSAIKITTAHYLTPNHEDINLKGIQPNLDVVENPHAQFGDISKDAQLRAAIGMLQKKIADTKP